MAMKEVKTTFLDVKLEALEYFLREQGSSVEDALKEQINKIYDKNVPKDVRKFLESKLPSEEITPAQEEEPVQGPTTPRQPRRTPRANSRRAENVQTTQEAPIAEEAVVQEETPEAGMVMEM